MKRNWLLLLGLMLGSGSATSLAQSSSIPPTTPTIPSSSYDVLHPPPAFGPHYQDRVNYDVFAQSSVVSRKNYYADAQAVAQCLVKRVGAGSGALIGGALNNDPKFNRLSQALAGKYDSCTRSARGSVPLVAVNAALAEQLTRATSMSLPRYSSGLNEVATKAFYEADGRFTIDNLGRCVAAYSPGLVNQVLSTSPGTRSETDALATVYAETPACSVRTTPADVPLIVQRNALATGLYAWLNRG